MYIFALTVSIFLFLAYHYVAFEQRQVMLSWFIWGIVFCVPGLMLRNWLMFLYPYFWGSVFLVYSFSMMYFIVPLALALTGMYFTLRIKKKTIPEPFEIEAFLLGWSSLFLISHSIENWGNLYWIYALAIPLLYLSLLCFAISWIREFFIEDFPGTLLPAGILLGMALGAGLIVSLTFFGLGSLTVIATVFTGAGAVFYWIQTHRELVH